MHSMNYQTLEQNRPLEGLWSDRKARVLLIDDDRTTRRMVAKSLEDHCDLILASNASQGISSYNAYEPDLVFMDIELPDGDGQSLLSWIMHNDPGAYVVMFSGHYDGDNLLDSIDNGARGFVSKPYDLEKLLFFIKMCPKLH